jgi:hypothetical protein
MGWFGGSKKQKPAELPTKGLPPRPQSQGAAQGLPSSVQPVQQSKAAKPELFGGAPPPPPSASTSQKRPPRPAGSSKANENPGYWTRRGLPGFTLTVPEHKIVNKIVKPTTPSSSPPLKSGGSSLGSKPVGISAIAKKAGAPQPAAASSSSAPPVSAADKMQTLAPAPAPAPALDGPSSWNVYTAVDRLQRAGEGERDLALACMQHLCTLCIAKPADRKAAVAIGGIKAVAAMMRRHSADVELVQNGCTALRELSAPDLEVGSSGTAASVAADIVTAVAQGMAGCRKAETVQRWGCDLVDVVVGGADANADARRAEAAGRGMIGAVIAALRAHPASEFVQECGLRCLRQICRGSDPGRGVRGDVTLHLGALKVAIVSIRQHHRHARSHHTSRCSNLPTRFLPLDLPDSLSLLFLLLLPSPPDVYYRALVRVLSPRLCSPRCLVSGATPPSVRLTAS